MVSFSRGPVNGDMGSRVLCVFRRECANACVLAEVTASCIDCVYKPNLVLVVVLVVVLVFGDAVAERHAVGNTAEKSLLT